MEIQHKPFWCYLDNTDVIISNKRPDNFQELSYPYHTRCPNVFAAKRAYETHLKIAQWRNNETVK